jgi:uncharacterized protein (TIGR03792 family)
MMIEWLKFNVPPELREKFIQIDEEVWSTGLAGYPGYLGKEVWIDASAPHEVVLVIRWASQQAWDAVPTDRLQQLEATFSSKMKGAYQLIESRAYQQRKFPQMNN